VEQGILPHEKALADRGDRGLDEERRLCYVGFTRARKLLRVTWCEKRQETFSRDRAARYRACAPSRFLLEAGLMGEGEYEASAYGVRGGKKQEGREGAKEGAKKRTKNKSAR
jgi:superfamily I DNA/RNA helicase